MSDCPVEETVRAEVAFVLVHLCRLVTMIDIFLHIKVVKKIKSSDICVSFYIFNVIYFLFYKRLTQ